MLSSVHFRASVGRALRRMTTTRRHPCRKSQIHQIREIKTLTLDAGTTTLKYSLFDVTRKALGGGASSLSTELILGGFVDRVGLEGGGITHKMQAVVKNETIKDHLDALTRVANLLKESDQIQLADIDCVGHRVVHGGASFSSPAIIDSQVRDEVLRLKSLAPLHNDAAVAGIDASQSLFPDATHVAIFDTAFHATIPPSAYRYAIPEELYEEQGIRRYGFHGTSYRYVVNQAAKYLGKSVDDCNMIAMHLGNGASMCCVKGGKSIDTTMGLTPLEGLVMSTRSGDIDPGIYDQLLASGNSAEEVSRILNKQSGLLGLSGTSDMRTVRQWALDGDSRSRLAREIYVERIRQYLGSYLLKLEGDVDAIVFTGGIGERDHLLREAVCEGLGSFHIIVDKSKNDVAQEPDHIMEIQEAFSTKLLVVPTHEEISIAMQSAELVLPPLPEEPKIEAPSRKTFHSNLCCHSVGNSYTAAEELGLISVFSASVERVGYFRPIRCDESDNRIELMNRHFEMNDDTESMYALNEDEAWDMVAEGREDELFELVLEKYLKYCESKDFVLVSTKTEGDDSLHLSAKLCSALNVPAIFTGEASKDAQFSIAQTVFERHGAKCLGAIVSGVEDIDEEKKKLEELDLKPIAILPREDTLTKRTMAEVMTILPDTECLYGQEYLQNVVDSANVFSMQVDDMLPLVKENELIVFYANRVDSLMSLILSAQSSNAPKPAGVLLTLNDSTTMNPRVRSILNGIEDIRFPVLGTGAYTLDSAYDLKHSPFFIRPESTKKIHAARMLMESHFDYSFLDHFSSEDSESRDIGPRLFQYSTFLKGREAQKTIVLPEGLDSRVVEAASILASRKLCKVLLIGEPQAIRAHADKLRVSIDGITIIEPQRYDKLDEMVDAFVEARKKKGLTPEEARELLLSDVNYFGTLMMQLGIADGMVSGAMHSSANTIRPALQILKTAPGASIVSSIFFMLLEDGVKVFGDCAINVNPNSEQLAEIAIASAKTAKEFGLNPRVALLSYATGDSNKGDLVNKVIDATEAAKKRVQDLGFMDPALIEGPLQFDAAVDPEVAAHKMKGSAVAGNANVLIFPDLNAGNNGYKAVQQATKTVAVGPILQGLRKPVNDLSRGATTDDIVNTAVLTALQASHVDK